MLFCLRENSEYGSYIGSNVPMSCPSDNCGSSPKKVNCLTAFLWKMLLKKCTQCTMKPPFILIYVHETLYMYIYIFLPF